MMETVASWAAGVLVVLFSLYAVYFNAIRISAKWKWKCRKEKYIRPFKPCHNSECKFSVYCDKYEHTYTKEDIAELCKLVDEWQKQA